MSEWQLLIHGDSLQADGYTVHGILKARILEWVVFPFFRGSSEPRDRTQISHTAGRFFLSWATGKAKNTGVGSTALLQWIFLTQESNHGLLHCRRILYQLSYQGSPKVTRSCPTLRPHGLYTAQGILWARTVEWVAFPFSRESSQPRDLKQLLKQTNMNSVCFKVGMVSIQTENTMNQEWG